MAFLKLTGISEVDWHQPTYNYSTTPEVELENVYRIGRHDVNL